MSGGAEMTVLRGHEAQIQHVVFNLDGSRIVTASVDGTARLWETATGKEIVRLRGHKGAVQVAAFNLCMANSYLLLRCDSSKTRLPQISWVLRFPSLRVRPETL